MIYPLRKTWPLILLALPRLSVAQPDPTPQQIEFFENKIRPVLAEHCYQCHSADSKKLKGELLLDSRPGWMAGGESGAVIVPGHPGESLIISALRYEKFEMPPKKKLDEEVIGNFIEWIEMGAPDPRTEIALPTTGTKTEVFDLAARKQIWSLQPVTTPELPAVEQEGWPRADHDHFVLAELEKRGWRPAEPASRQSWLRRVTFDLTGLPPKPAEMEAFLADTSPGAHERVVDRLLASPHFGEQWARHWMDLVRYAETKAFEADYPMPAVYHYRDYLIRAFNADLPYDQLLREAVAGDLIEPRLDPGTGINESVIGPGYLYLTDGQHGPPDIHADEARIFDDMIDVLGKAFLSQTIACTRCHDHKFDAITAADYYSLYGIIGSSRIDYANINPPGRQEQLREQLHRQKAEVRTALASVLEADMKTVREDLLAARSGTAKSPQQRRWATALEKKSNPEIKALAKLLEAADTNEPDKLLAPLSPKTGDMPETIGGISRESFGEWKVSGRSFEDAPRPSGDFVIPESGDQAVVTFTGNRAAAGHLASRFAGSIKSPDFTISGDSVTVRVKGKNARVSLYVRHYELVGRGPTTGGTTKVINSDTWVDHRFNTKLWHGERAYIEVLQNGGQMNFKFSIDGHQEGSYAVLDRASNNGPLPALRDTGSAWAIDQADRDHLLDHVTVRIRGLAPAWRTGRLTPAQGDLLEALHEAGVFDFSIGRSEELKRSVEAIRKLQQDVPAPTYVRSLADGPGFDEPIYIRGSHKNISQSATPRHFLDGIDGKPFAAPGSGRLQWAAALTSEENPLTARVMVNRIWHHLFGRGIVASVDDFGHMGDRPTHPEMLDHLAGQFVDDGWSIKTMIRRLVLSSTYRMSSRGHPDAIAGDPDNHYLQRMPVRRLQAEAIRDTILAVSGQLDPKLHGPSIGGDGGNRRSVYIQLKRRYMPEFLMTFDLPNSTETFGRRNITASPTQSLAMMNSPFVWKAADHWAKAVMGAKPATFAERVDLVHQQAFGRPASERDLAWARTFLEDHKLDEEAGAKHREVWRQLCHTMLNRKELIYLY